MSNAILPLVPAPAITPPPVKPPRAPTLGPAPRRWTLAEYRKLAEVGLLTGLRPVLINGEILTMPPPGPAHDVALTLTAAFLASVCPPGHHARNQQSFNVGTHNDLCPDLTIVAGAIRDYVSQAPTSAVLAVEVSDSSLFLDTTTKAELYATAGVPEYWVLDLEHRQLLIFRDPQPLPAGLGATAYRTHTTFGLTEHASTLFAPAAPVLVSDLLP